MRRYFVGILLVIALLTVLIVLITDSSSSGPKNKVPLLTNYANSSSSVSLMIDGPVNAQVEHNQAKVIIDSTNATVEALQGYNGDVINSQTYPNTQTAYNVFLHALQYAGFTLGNPASDLSNDDGYCPTGIRYTFELQQNGQTIENYWTTDCGGTPHSFDGNLGLNLTLFQQQIPDYGQVTGNLNL